jgi:hypothetical protein
MLTGKLAGVAIAAGDACYIDTATDRVLLSTGAAANAAAYVDGFAATAAAIGQPVTLFRGGVHMHYGAGLSPGTTLFLSGTVAGGLDTAASTGDAVGVARVFTASVIRVFGTR